jgi:hypothetical protein
VKIFGMVLAVLFALFVAVATGTRSFEFMMLVTNKHEFISWTALVCLELGLLLWVILIFASDGIGQIITSGLMIFITLLGIAVTSVGEVFLTSSYTARPGGLIVSIAIGFVAALAVINATALIIYHVADDDVLFRFQEKLSRSRIRRSTLKRIRERADEISSRVADTQAAEWVQHILNEAGMNSLESVPSTARPVATKPAPLPEGEQSRFFGLSNLLSRRQQTQPSSQSQPVSATTPEQPTTAPEATESKS